MRDPGAFWSWFQSNASRIRSAGPDSTMPGEITAQLQRIHPKLVWEIAPAQKGAWEFVVSADGDRSLFHAVRDVVNAAPPIPGFRVKAFRQRGNSLVVRFGRRSLSSSDLWFSAENAGAGAVSVTLYIRGLTPSNDRDLAGAAVILLDELLGEYDACLRIAALHRERAPRAPEKAGLKPFVELRTVVDALDTSASGS